MEYSSHNQVELVSADVLSVESLKDACRGCDIVYYLVHSMNSENNDFEKTDRMAAKNMIEAAKVEGVKRIIYLGGLGEQGQTLSKHLRSRREVSEILHSGSVPVTTLRAAIIIGKGSVAFEILRHLVHKLPIMVTPRWVSTESQPIALDNVIEYLARLPEIPASSGQVYDIGGPDILSYKKLMEIYVKESGLSKRWIIPVPVLTPKLSSLWISLVTPFPAYIARPLAEGLRNRTVCQNNSIRELIPQTLLTCREAIRKTL